MLKLNQTVMYGTTGVCVVEKIEEKKIDNKMRQYFVLKPISVSTSTVFVPADSDVLMSKVRELVTEEEIKKMLHSLADAESVWVDVDSERKQYFGATVMSGDRMAFLALFKTLILHQKELSEKGKRLHLADERALREVQRLLCDEFSFVLNISTDDAYNLILSSF